MARCIATLPFQPIVRRTQSPPKKAKVSESQMSLAAAGAGQCLNRGRTEPKAASYRPTGPRRLACQLASDKQAKLVPAVEQTAAKASNDFLPPSSSPARLRCFILAPIITILIDANLNPDFIQATPPHRLASSTARQAGPHPVLHTVSEFRVGASTLPLTVFLPPTTAAGEVRSS